MKRLFILGLLLSGCVSQVSKPVVVTPVPVVEVIDPNFLYLKKENVSMKLPLDWVKDNSNHSHLLLEAHHSKSSTSVIIAKETETSNFSDDDLRNFLIQQTKKRIDDFELRQIPYRLSSVKSPSKGNLPAFQYIEEELTVTEVYIIKNHAIYSLNCTFSQELDVELLSKGLDGCAMGLETLEIK